ncbi:MAG: N-6 DNA methylase [Chitinophagales bacterium]
MQENPKNKLGQYFTPTIVADFMISLANINPDAAILEPACGEGVFLDLLQQKGFRNLTAYEIDPQLATAYSCVRYESFVAATSEEKYDLVIGNPPYIRWKNLEARLKEELTENPLWNQYFNSLCDYLYIFILKSIECLKENGQLIFICPEYWMNTTHSLSLRNYMVEKGYFEKIFHFNETPIFDNATISVVIFKYVKSQKAAKPNIEVAKYYQKKALNLEVLKEMNQSKSGHPDIQKFSIPPFEVHQRWLLISEKERGEVEEFEKACVDLTGKDEGLKENYDTIGDVCEIGNGMVSGLDKAFQLEGQLLDEMEVQHSIQVVKAKHLRPFHYQQTTPYLFVNGVKSEEELKTHFPNFYEKLQPFKTQLQKRYQYNRLIPYWNWVFLRNYKLFASDKPRIFVPCKERISNKDYFRFAYVGSGIFPTQDVTALFLKETTKESIYYVLAFLNHPKVFHWLRNKGIVKGSIVEFSEKPLSSIPFRKINWANPTEVKWHGEISRLTLQYLQNELKGEAERVNVLLDKLLK